LPIQDCGIGTSKIFIIDEEKSTLALEFQAFLAKMMKSKLV